MVKAAKDACEKSEGTIVVHGTDTDLMMLLLFHCYEYKNLFNNEMNISNVWSHITENERKVFLVAYCFTGVDTVSSIYGKGKATILQLFSSNTEIRESIVPAFLDPDTSIARIDELGVSLMRIVYGKTASETLTKMRTDTYKKQCLVG